VHQLPKNGTQLDIPLVILKIYLIPLAKMIFLLWLLISGKIIVGFAIYLLFGLYKLYSYKRIKDANTNSWVVTIISCILLWPVLDIFTFFPPKKNYSEQ
jgi:hypothetical protein